MASLQQSSSEDGVRTLTLDRPERKNAIDLQLAAELTDALRAAEADDAVRAVVVTPAGLQEALSRGSAACSAPRHDPQDDLGPSVPRAILGRVIGHERREGPA